MTVIYTEVPGERYAEELQAINGKWTEDFLKLTDAHLRDGFWWLAMDNVKVVGFCGMIPFEPFPGCGYMKRAALLPEYRGRGRQRAMIQLRMTAAKRRTSWTHMFTETHVNNAASSNSFISEGFKLVTPDRPWATETLFWRKEIDR